MVWSRALSLLLLAGVLLLASSGHAQLTLSAPSPSTVKACDDYFTDVFHNPVDMSDTGDVNNFFPTLDINNISGASLANGVFSGSLSVASGLFYLTSPKACGAYPVGGRFGELNPPDVAKYTHLTTRMNIDTEDPYGLRYIFDRNCNYAGADRSITASSAIPTRTGWGTYTTNLNSLSFTTNTAGWSTGSINSIAVLPSHIAGTGFQIDYVRLEDPTSCSSESASFPFSATTQGNNNRYSLYLDTDSDLFNGYSVALAQGQAASGASSASLSSPLGLAPGSYNLIGILDSDYATLNLNNPWDMSGSDDILVTGSLNNVTYSGGALNGTTSSSGAQIYFEVGSGIPAAQYNKVSLKISGPLAPPDNAMRLTWNSGFVFLRKDLHDPDNDGIYTYDLSTSGSWSGTISQLVLVVPEASRAISLDFLALRSSGYVTSLSTSAITAAASVSSGAFTVNSPPQVAILQPDQRGGEAIRSWNMNSGDFQTFGNLVADSDTSYPGELLSTYLPDVRTVDGVRGDLFKGTNTSGSDDAINYSTFYTARPPITFSSSEYRHLCFKLLIDAPFNIGDGSVARVLWRDTSGNFTTGEDIVLIYDGWSGSQWKEYCVDMDQYYVDGTTAHGWSGTIDAFRVDPHEFRAPTSYYFDYIKLRRNDESPTGTYTIVYQLADSDSAATVSLYYNTTASTSGGTLIASGLSELQTRYDWDTSTVPDGTYYIYAVATDGRNQNERLASGPVTVKNISAPRTPSPATLSVESPQDGDVICSAMQVKGYALHTDRLEDVASIEVEAGGTQLGMLTVGSYSGAAKVAYPSADSSNAGFNGSIDVSGLSAGSHTVTVRAVSTDGAHTSRDVVVTKAGSGCTATRSDSAPAGVPVPAEITTNPAITSAPILSTPKYLANGTISMKVTRQGVASDCTIALYMGNSATSVSTLVRSYTVSSAQATRGLSFSAKRFMVNKRRLKRLFFMATKSCAEAGSTTSRSSTVRAVNVATSSGAANLGAAARSLRRLIKVTPP